MITVEKGNKIPKLSKSQTVGVVTNFLTEQFIKRDFKTKKMNIGECEEVIEKNKIEIVFIENNIYEEDHDWYHFTLDDTLEYFKRLNVNIVIINHEEDMGLIDEECFQMNISKNAMTPVYEKNMLTTPMLFNENILNPAESKKTKDIIFVDFDGHEAELSEDKEKFIKTIKPSIDIIASDKVTRPVIKNIIQKIKKSKVLYVQYKEDIDQTFLRDLDLVCVARKTIMVVDPLYSFTPKYSFKSPDSESDMNYLQSFLNGGLHNDHRTIGNARRAFLENSMIKYRGLDSLLNGDVETNSIGISVVTSTKRKWTIGDYIERLNNQNHVHIEAVLLTHGFELTEEEKSAFCDLAKFDLEIISATSDTVFGACLNMCIDRISLDYFTKIDDDDFYYPNYLIDSWISLKYSNADIVGKYSQFVYMEEEDLTVQRFSSRQNLFSEYVAGATIFCETDFVKHYMFNEIPKAVDSDILRRVQNDGGKIYCTHPYEFCIFRAGDKGAHTWQAPDTHLLRSADILFYGDPEDSLSIN